MNQLTMTELDEVSAGLTWQQIGVGVAIVSLAISIAATGGLAAIPVGTILGAGLASEIGLAGFAVGLAGAGGAVAGSGMVH